MIIPATVPEGLGHTGVAAATAAGAGLSVDWHSHTLIVAAMTSFYLCDLSMSSSPHARLAMPAVLEAMGRLARPTMLILGARRATGRVVDRLAAYLLTRRGSHRVIQLDRRRLPESARHRS